MLTSYTIYNLSSSEDQQESDKSIEWAHSLWKYLHTMSTQYPDTPSLPEQLMMRQWLQTLVVTLPCPKCQRHYAEYLNENYDNMDTVVASRDNLFQFFVDLHNQVNIRNNKPIISLEEAKRLYY